MTSALAISIGFAFFLRFGFAEAVTVVTAGGGAGGAENILS